MRKSLLMCLAVVVGLITGCSNNVSIVSLKNIEKIDEINALKREIKLPTYVPFEVNEVVYKEVYRGPQKIHDGVVLQLEEGNPKYTMQDFMYYSGDNADIDMQVLISNASVSPISIKSHYDEDKLEEFDEDKKGLYQFNGVAQLFSWEEDGLQYDLWIIKSPDSRKKDDKAPLKKNEIKKIAKSFASYNH